MQLNLHPPNNNLTGSSSNMGFDSSTVKLSSSSSFPPSLEATITLATGLLVGGRWSSSLGISRRSLTLGGAGRALGGRADRRPVRGLLLTSPVCCGSLSEIEEVEEEHGQRLHYKRESHCENIVKKNMLCDILQKNQRTH